MYNFFILANSKLHILKSIDFFLENLDTSGFRINYMDTGNVFVVDLIFDQFSDSMVMSLSKPLDELVLPGRESLWTSQKPNWFVTDPDCPDQKREPGVNFNLGFLFIILKVYLKKNFLLKAALQSFSAQNVI